MIWFTADHHFGHANIIKYTDRPWATVEEMDAALVEAWNGRVQPDDTVYHLGDFTLGGNDAFVRYVKQLNGHINFVPGGHDHIWLDYRTNGKTRVGVMFNVTILPPLVTLRPERGPWITLCHYPMRSWEGSFRDGVHLYGHEHGRIPPLGRSMDVGVDTNELYAPYSMDEVLVATRKESE